VRYSTGRSTLPASCKGLGPALRTIFHLSDVFIQVTNTPADTAAISTQPKQFMACRSATPSTSSGLMLPVPLHRNCVALVAVWSVLGAQACSAYQRPPVGIVVEPGAHMRVQSAVPFVVRPATFADTAAVAGDCRATLVEGAATTASADAVMFRSLSHLVSANLDDGSCRWATKAAVIVSTNGADVTLRRYSGKRTAVLLIALTLAFLVYAAYGLSQMDFPISGGGDCAFC
jgi:hypothetical protein